MQNKNFKIINYSKGFTLIELIVVIAVFMFIVGAAISVFISIVGRQKEILSEQQVINQISYAQEYMSKALRMAKTATDDSCIPTGYTYLLTRYDYDSGFFKGVEFVSQPDDNTSGNAICREFYLDTDNVLKEYSDYYGGPTTITPQGLQIDSIRFGIDGSDGSAAGLGRSGTDACGACNDEAVCGSAAAAWQPRITIPLNVKIAGESQDRAIQTTVSQRNLNVK